MSRCRILTRERGAWRLTTRGRCRSMAITLYSPFFPSFPVPPLFCFVLAPLLYSWPSGFVAPTLHSPLYLLCPTLVHRLFVSFSFFFSCFCVGRNWERIPILQYGVCTVLRGRRVVSHARNLFRLPVPFLVLATLLVQSYICRRV